MTTDNRDQKRCPFCHGEDVRLKWRKHGYDFLSCRVCGLIFLNPMPQQEEIDRYYEQEFFTGGGVAGYVNYDREQRWRRRNYERDLRDIEKLIKPGRILDVGCATGSFLDICSERWDRYGIEVSRFAGEEAQKHFGDRIKIEALSRADYPSDYFDVVTLWETVNHMIDPLGDLRTVHRVLKPGGIVAISVGDVGSPLARLMGKYWYHVTPPIHLYYFRRRTFDYLFDKLGFEIAKLHYPGKYVDLATAFERVKDTTSSRGLRSLARMVSNTPLAAATLYINLMDTMYIYARKKG